MKKIDISICLGSSCFSRGNSESVHLITQYIKKHNLDANISSKGCLCTGNCTEGPLIKINGKLYKNVMPATVIDILNHVVSENKI